VVGPKGIAKRHKRIAKKHKKAEKFFVPFAIPFVPFCDPLVPFCDPFWRSLLSVVTGTVTDFELFFFQLGVRDLDGDFAVGAVAVLVRR
jgi:hypothetical protein